MQTNKPFLSARQLARCAMIAAVYTVLCLSFAPLAFGPVQLRFAEALVLLPVFGPEYILAGTLGCFLSNLWAPPCRMWSSAPWPPCWPAWAPTLCAAGGCGAWPARGPAPHSGKRPDRGAGAGLFLFSRQPGHPATDPVERPHGGPGRGGGLRRAGGGAHQAHRNKRRPAARLHRVIPF